MFQNSTLDKTERFSKLLDFIALFRSTKSSLDIESIEFGKFKVHIEGGVNDIYLTPKLPENVPDQNLSPGDDKEEEQLALPGLDELDARLQEEFEGESGHDEGSPETVQLSQTT